MSNYLPVTAIVDVSQLPVAAAADITDD